MATKKAASSAKKTSKKSTNATTNVTTVKAVEPRPMAASTTAVMNKFSLKNSSAVSALIAEFIGTFALAAAIVAGQGQPIIVLFALVGVVLTVGVLSGGYVNPALTIAAWVTRRITGLRAIGYIVAQFLGAMLAFTVLNMFVNATPAPATDAASLYSSAPTLFQAAAIPQAKEWLVFLAELIGASIFGFAVAGATREIKERTAAAFTVGLGAFLGLMLAGSAAAFVGGTSILNPAVAVALQAINFNSMWPVLVYVIGASLGAVIGFVLHDLLRSAENK
jgi:aquaporin Z